MVHNTSLFVNEHPVSAPGGVRVLDLHADYVCGNSGGCCREGWDIPVSGTEHAALINAMQEAGTPADQAAAFFKPLPSPQDPGRVTFARNEKGECVFAGRCEGASFCSAQKQWGHGVLPSICQSYPRLAVATPAGVYLTLSYTCPTAARLLREPGRLREGAPRAVLGMQPRLKGVWFAPQTPAPALTPQVRPPWEVFDYFWRWAVEWMASEELAPSQALYWLGLFIEKLEELAPQIVQLPVLADVLDQIMALEVEPLRRQCEAIPSCTPLGMVHLSTLLGVMQRTQVLPPVLAPLAEALAQGHASPAFAQLGAEYDRRLRPHVKAFETIERNYLASRLLANPLCYLSDNLRMGYFMVVLLSISLRFNVLALCMQDERTLCEEAWLEAAGMNDKLFEHSARMQEQILGLLRGSTGTAMHNLAAPALF